MRADPVLFASDVAFNIPFFGFFFLIPQALAETVGLDFFC